MSPVPTWVSLWHVIRVAELHLGSSQVASSRSQVHVSSEDGGQPPGWGWRTKALPWCQYCSRHPLGAKSKPCAEYGGDRPAPKLPSPAQAPVPRLCPSEGAFPPAASLHCVQIVVRASCRSSHILGPGFLPSRGGDGLTRGGSSTSAEHEVQGHGFQKRATSTAQARKGEPARQGPGVTTKGHSGPCVETLLLCHIRLLCPGWAGSAAQTQAPEPDRPGSGSWP